MRTHLFILVLTCLLIGVLALAMRQISLAAHVEPGPTFDPIENTFMVGSPYPRNAYCDWPHTTNSVLYCDASQEDGHIVSFSYDAYLHEIRDVAIETHDKSVGDLILAWGRPTGVKPDDYGVFVYWQGRYAYTAGRAFRPNSAVGFVAYVLEEPPFLPWAGFVNRPVVD